MTKRQQAEAVFELIKAWTGEVWLNEAFGLVPEDFIARLEAGVPREWAEAIAKTSKGRVPLAAFPPLLPTPRLLSTGQKGTLGTDDMEAQTATRGAAVSAAKTKPGRKFPDALHRRNLSVPEWARAQRKPPVDVEVAKSWVKRPGKGGRPIPRVWADRIAAEFLDEQGRPEVPAVPSSWPNGIRE